MHDTYQSVADPSEVQIKVRGSRFIAKAFRVDDEEQALEIVKRIRNVRHDATHHCFAYRLGIDGRVARTSDDGEPFGTAGQPILQQIDARTLTNTLTVVTRYYGGTKLGRGGLTRAYGDAASQSLDESGATTHYIYQRYQLSFSYDDTSPAMHVIASAGGLIRDTAYTEKTRIIVDIRAATAADFERSFVEELGGRGSLQKADD